MEVHDSSNRDSHDLSLDATRFSVVDSMLMSLSDIPPMPTAGSPGHSSPYHDPALEDLYPLSVNGSPTKRANASNLPPRQKGLTYPPASDASQNPANDLASRYSAFHAAKNRQEGATIVPRAMAVARAGTVPYANNTSDDVFGGITTGKENLYRHTRSTAIKGSVGSGGSSSVDMGTPRSVNRSYPRDGSRAASLDYAAGERAPLNLSIRVPNISEQPQHAFDLADLDDAAPTPTVPGGPRRWQDPLSPAIGSQPPTPKRAQSRRNSIRSIPSKMKKKSDTMDANVLEQARQFVHASNSYRGQPPVDPSPGILSNSGSRRNSVHPNAQASKEQRPNFFRRLFGSSKHHEDDRDLVSPPPIPPIPQTATNAERPKTQPHHRTTGSQSKFRPSTQDTAASKEQNTAGPGVLKKSHSSFFRRRKKSVSEPARPPLPTTFPLPRAAQPATPPRPLLNKQNFSPESNSLRQAMNPYLHEITSSPVEMFYDSRERQPTLVEGDMPGFVGNGLGIAQTMEPTAASSRNLDLNRHLSRTEKHADPAATSQVGMTRLHVLQSSFAPTSTLGEAAAPSQTTSPLASAFRREKSPSRRPPSPPTVDAPPSTPPQQRRIMPSPLILSYSDQLAAQYEAGLITLPSQTSHNGKQNALLQSTIDQEQVSELDLPLDGTTHTNGDFVVSPVSPSGKFSLRTQSSKSNRVWLAPTAAEERAQNSASSGPSPQAESPLRRAASPPLLTSSPGRIEATQSNSGLPLVLVDTDDLQSPDWADREAKATITISEQDITEEDRELARQIFMGEETQVTKAEAAAWLGRATPIGARTRRAYMELYDWSCCHILGSFRDLCNRLVVKAESQQLDRVIDAFSERWCACNPSHGFKDQDVVHTITYSILMLNTDLHIAELDQRMSRNQFVKNTLPTIRNIAEAAAASAPPQNERAPSRQFSIKDAAMISSMTQSPSYDRSVAEERQSFEVKRSRGRLSVVRQDSDGPLDFRSMDNCNLLVNKPYDGGLKGWEFQVETVLKEFYSSIRAQKLPLHGVSDTSRRLREEPSSNSLSVASGNMRRTPSVLSKAPSENISYRGRPYDFRSATGRFVSRNRSKQRPYPSSTIGSSRTSLDDQSVFSPAGSTWSKYSMGKTHTTLSVDSLGTSYGQGDYQQAIGFANALSQAIIREESGNFNNLGSEENAGRPVPLLEDDTLELAGPPWAKEGIVRHRHHLESVDKKAKSRDWNECFAVIEKGWMKLFSFNTPSAKSTKALRNRSKSKSSGSGPGATVGGGNWSEKAEALGQFLLRQTIASALPPPGFSKTRPHVFALSLPTGAVHLFAVGTAEIVKEFVTTANYWSARLSKEPLVGGVSNIEYGWSDAIINVAQQQRAPGTQGSDGSSFARSSVVSPLQQSPRHTPRQSSSHSIPILSSSLGRGSIDQGSGGFGQAGSKGRIMPGDRIQVSDWQPPTNSMMASNLMEVDQLSALTAYVQNVEEELRGHNELRSLMSLAYSPRNPNAIKAMQNWEKKSAYLLKEIVKFRTYIDSLEAAQKQKERIYKDREDRPQQAPLVAKRASTAPSIGLTGPSNTYVSGLANARKPSFASIVSRSTNANSEARDGALTRASGRSSGIGIRMANEPEGVDFSDDEMDDDEGMDEATREAIAASRNASRVDLRTSR